MFPAAGFSRAILAFFTLCRFWRGIMHSRIFFRFVLRSEAYEDLNAGKYYQCDHCGMILFSDSFIFVSNERKGSGSSGVIITGF